VDYFPVFMDLRGQRCVVVGGGEVAARKINLLVRAGAQVRVIAPHLELGAREQFGQAVSHEAREYTASDLDAAVLVIAATNRRSVNAQVSSDARARGLPVNVVDDPALCSVIVPALVDRSPVLVAIGTGGSAPVLARLLRGRLEAQLPAAYGELAALCAELRACVQAALPEVARRRRFWEEVLEGEAAELVFRGERAAAAAAIRGKLAAMADAAPARGEIYLIGVGPNDPELVCFRALRWLERADLVLVTSGVDEAIVELSRRDAAREHLSGELASAADGVMPRLAAVVAAGQRACVLAHGDAFREDSGRHWSARLGELGLPHQVVPGIAV
jgi:uroporphyrin-III C-methyltransferase/precorrin-2 dehydrogenase/sirohydrochlorin ferrochelatase